MAVIIGSARHDEHGNCYSGGKAGDQTGQEVSTQKFYNHSKGWYVLRAKDDRVAEKLAEAMQIASDNKISAMTNRDATESLNMVLTQRSRRNAIVLLLYVLVLSMHPVRMWEISIHLMNDR